MFTLGTYFDVLLQNIRPPEERLKAAKDLPPRLPNGFSSCPFQPTLVG